MMVTYSGSLSLECSQSKVCNEYLYKYTIIAKHQPPLPCKHWDINGMAAPSLQGISNMSET